MVDLETAGSGFESLAGTTRELGKASNEDRIKGSLSSTVYL